MKNYKWYALNTVSNNEKKFKEDLINRIEQNNLSEWVSRVEIPIEKMFVYVKGKKTVRDRIVMPGYILLEADITNGELLETIRSCKNFLGFINPSIGGLTRRGFPEEMSKKDVARFLDLNEKNLNPKWKFEVGDTVKITEGAFSTFKAIVTKIDVENKKLDVIFKIFERENNITLEFKQVEKSN